VYLQICAKNIFLIECELYKPGQPVKSRSTECVWEARWV